MRLKYILYLTLVFLTACNISEEDADNFYKLGMKSKKEPYLMLQYFDRASAHEKYRVYSVAIQMFDTGCYLWQRKDILDVNQIYLEECIIKSVEIFYEVASNENSEAEPRFKSVQNLAYLFDHKYSNYHKIASDLLTKNDPKLLEKITSVLNELGSQTLSESD